MDALFQHRLFTEVGKNVALPVFAWKYERVLLATVYQDSGFPRWLSGKESTLYCGRCRRRGFDPSCEDPLAHSS